MLAISNQNQGLTTHLTDGAVLEMALNGQIIGLTEEEATSAREDGHRIINTNDFVKDEHGVWWGKAHMNNVARWNGESLPFAD
jgi:hypothetical protein